MGWNHANEAHTEYLNASEISPTKRIDNSEDLDNTW